MELARSGVALTRGMRRRGPRVATMKSTLPGPGCNGARKGVALACEAPTRTRNFQIVPGPASCFDTHRAGVRASTNFPGKGYGWARGNRSPILQNSAVVIHHRAWETHTTSGSVEGTPKPLTVECALLQAIGVMVLHYTEAGRDTIGPSRGGHGD
jgi:hypothetical protein